jgi:hypothetical protein
MPRGFFRPLLWSVFLLGRIHAQEVVVPHETKPEAPEQAAPSSESEQAPAESATPARTKRKSREKKSVAPTLDQMHSAGALAAEGQNDRPVSQPARKGASHSEMAAAPTPAVSTTPRPVKREAQVEQKSASRSSTLRGNKLEPIGPVRPTIIESGREQPSATPLPKWQRGEKTPAP